MNDSAQMLLHHIHTVLSKLKFEEKGYTLISQYNPAKYYSIC